MTIRILTDAATLAKSRFVASPAFEIMATLRGRSSETQPIHARRWHSRALARLDTWTVDLLHALVPDDDTYVPDFLTPHPSHSRESREQMVEAISTAPKAEVDHQLDYLAREPMHPAVAELRAAGPVALAQAAATAFGRFFDAAIAEDWSRVTVVLDTDIAHRSETVAERGLADMFASLSEQLRWEADVLTLDRAAELTVDWADDGLLLVPCTALDGSILVTIEQARTPLLTYSARGTAVLRSSPHDRPDHLGELLGATRLGILQRLDDPHTTQALSQLDGHAPATVSYHLGVLQRGGLVFGRRSGRGVLYRRTALGDAILNGELPHDDRRGRQN